VRSRLPQDEARRRYVELGELHALEQIRRDSARLDKDAIAVGPFARLDANAVAAHDGKTRGAITNLFGSQAAFQIETMARALSASDEIARVEYPDPAAYTKPAAWVDALFSAEAERGPRRGGKPRVTYASLWALWLSAVPYGLWSGRVAGPSVEEYRAWVERLEDVIGRALERFGLALRAGVTLGDLACACASVVEGAWLNQCLAARHPLDASEPIGTVLRRSGRLVWDGATEPRA
jgi:hypothetical protein